MDSGASSSASSCPAMLAAALLMLQRVGSSGRSGLLIEWLVSVGREIGPQCHHGMWCQLECQLMLRGGVGVGSRMAGVMIQAEIQSQHPTARHAIPGQARPCHARPSQATLCHAMP